MAKKKKREAKKRRVEMFKVELPSHKKIKEYAELVQTNRHVISSLTAQAKLVGVHPAWIAAMECFIEPMDSKIVVKLVHGLSYYFLTGNREFTGLFSIDNFLRVFYDDIEKDIIPMCYKTN